ncbi:MAG TPA: hypothetical protein VK152_00410 [Paludibacter sp.]|nr:hypothetical protein [Paludibacter sp.]
MNSHKSKIRKYSTINRKAIAGVVLVPEKDYFRIYVAWEWPEAADSGFFAVMKSNKLYNCADEKTINAVCNFGDDITGTPEAKRIFHDLF